jgi:hypothetical protein
MPQAGKMQQKPLTFSHWDIADSRPDDPKNQKGAAERRPLGIEC